MGKEVCGIGGVRSSGSSQGRSVVLIPEGARGSRSAEVAERRHWDGLKGGPLRPREAEIRAKLESVFSTGPTERIRNVVERVVEDSVRRVRRH